jgi:thiol-disulfide isomerase/thioredoxin
MTERNLHGVITHMSSDTAHSGGKKMHYCGRAVGQSGYHDPCGDCDGRCGPTNGCQCKACAVMDDDSCRKIAVLICSSCGYLEFPGCTTHKSLLTQPLPGGVVGCAGKGCNTNTRTGWPACRKCPGRYTVNFWNLQVNEAFFARSNIQRDMVQTCILICSRCSTLTFPGNNSGLVSYNSGYVTDYSTGAILSIGSWFGSFDHNDSRCSIRDFSIIPVVLSREEANYVSETILGTYEETGDDLAHVFSQILKMSGGDSGVQASGARADSGGGGVGAGGGGGGGAGGGKVQKISSREEFKKVLSRSSNSLVVVDFWAEWCPPCRRIAPVYVELSKKYPSVSFYKIEDEAIHLEEGVTSIPTFKFYRNGRQIDLLEGADSATLEAKIQKNAAAPVDTHDDVKSISSSTEFGQVVKQHREDLVVVDFWQSWCPPCVKMAPVLSALSKKYPDVHFYKTDNDVIQREQGIEKLPTLRFYQGGRKVDEMTGFNPDLLEEKIKTYVNYCPLPGAKGRSGLKSSGTVDSEMRILQSITVNDSVTLTPRVIMKQIFEIQGFAVDPTDVEYAVQKVLNSIGSNRFGDGMSTFDCFINYRCDSDKDFAEKLYYALKAHTVHAFLDKKCLKTGMPWKEGFLKGLRNSKHFIACISRAGLAKIRDASQTHCHDNVLLEYEAALNIKSLFNTRPYIFLCFLEKTMATA